MYNSSGWTRGTAFRLVVTTTRVSWVDLIINAVFGLLPLLFIGNQVWMGLLAVALVWWLSLVYFKRKLGGVTGDCLGATQQLSEVVFYLCLGLMLVFN